MDEDQSLFTNNISGTPATGALIEIGLTITDDGSTNSTRGVATATITQESLAALAGDSYYYSIKALTSGSADAVVYSDDNFGVRGTVNILSGHYPA